MNATYILSEFAGKLCFEDLNDAVVETTRMYIADYYASCFAGYKVNKAFNCAMYDILENMGGKEEATVFFAEHKFPVEHAAYMNAIYAHGADIDDGNRKAMGHVAAHVMSAVFALAETMDVTWQDVFVAINVGYEVYNRISAAVQPGLVHRGFHSTGTGGSVACGAACAKLMRMDAEGIYNAMAIAAIQASGLLIVAESGQACKPLNPANAARTGIVAAKLAAAGVKGPINPLESKKGWFHAMAEKVNEDHITDGLGERFTICESYLKPYPSCRHTHCGIEAGIHIGQKMKRLGKNLSEVTAVDVKIYPNAIQIAGQIELPKTVDEAKFSVHYALAIALLYGRFSFRDLQVQNMDAKAAKLVSRIRLIPDPSMEDTSCGIRGAKVTVRFADNTVCEQTVLLPKGDAANPFSWEDMYRKTADCMEDLSDSSYALQFIQKARGLPGVVRYHSIRDLL